MTITTMFTTSNFLFDAQFTFVNYLGLVGAAGARGGDGLLDEASELLGPSAQGRIFQGEL